MRRHDLACKDFVSKLALKPKTAAHLGALTDRPEYLVARYAPEMAQQQSETNRMLFTLVEVIMKAGKYISEHPRTRGIS